MKCNEWEAVLSTSIFWHPKPYLLSYTISNFQHAAEQSSNV